MAVNKARFITQLEFKELPGTDLVELTADFKYWSVLLGRAIVVPKGFVCDLESIFWKSSDEAGCLHDYLYRRDSIPVVAKEIADSVFYEASLVDKCYIFMAWIKWAGVWLFSSNFYHRLKVADKPKR